MSASPPLPCMFDGEAFRPVGSFLRVAKTHFGEGEIVTLAVWEERSEATHRHEFAWLREAWMNLPDGLAEEYPSPEHLRKRALIATGWCHVRDYPCASKAEAERLRATLRRELDDYTVVVRQGDVVRVCRAKSQARSKMAKDKFQQSKTDILNYVAGLLEVSPDQLSKQTEAA